MALEAVRQGVESESSIMTTMNWLQFTPVLRLTAGSALMILIGLTALEGQLTPIEVIDGRPLAKVIRELENRHGWRVTYEDPVYEYANDLEDVTIIARRGSVPSGSPRLLVPRDRLFRFEYANTSANRPQEVIPALVKSYNSASYSDAFRVIQRGTLHHVVPTRSLDAKGQLRDRRSRLDVGVTVNDDERSAYQMLDAVLKQVSAAAGEPVGLGVVPMNLLMSTRVRGGAQKENARDVIVRTLEATTQNISWQLFCDPGALRLCALNLHLVPVSK
jgi:hypothetical protein